MNRNKILYTMANTEPKSNYDYYYFFLQIESVLVFNSAVTRLIIVLFFFVFLLLSVSIKNVLYSLASMWWCCSLRVVIFGIFISAWIFSVLKQCELIFSVYFLVFHWNGCTCFDQQPATHRQYYKIPSFTFTFNLYKH